ncbi:hypothetical protein E2C01_075981 [Portunus trituberculatus]|uniref:Uncharacterized protein n=1 Tax=Portunus trituberculatus TaxID=210409 RepID=A0A5B7IHR6_PORTR|nr:hypothetical protein [Portunus trituberculatus]
MAAAPAEAHKRARSRGGVCVGTPGVRAQLSGGRWRGGKDSLLQEEGRGRERTGVDRNTV